MMRVIMRVQSCSRELGRTRGGQQLAGRGVWNLALVPLVALLLVTLGCGGGQELDPPPPVPDRELYWALELNHHGVVMAVGDTLQLEATPRNYLGEVLPGLASPRFSSPNPDQLAVSPITGRLIALAPTTELLPIVATLTVGDLRHEDTVYVSVVDNPSPPVLATFSAHPVAPDSAKVGAYRGNSILPMLATLPVQATDVNGNLMTGLPVSLRSSDPLVLQIVARDGTHPMPINGWIKGIKPGTAMIYASVTAFGVTKADTVPYRIGWPVIEAMRLESPNSFFPSEIKVGAGAMVFFGFINGRFDTSDTLDVVFDDTALPNVYSPSTFGGWERLGSLGIDVDPFCSVLDCSAGNIALPGDAALPFVARVFSAPGIYEYRSPRHNATGRIVVVQDEH